MYPVPSHGVYEPVFEVLIVDVYINYLRRKIVSRDRGVARQRAQSICGGALPKQGCPVTESSFPSVCRSLAGPFDLAEAAALPACSFFPVTMVSLPERAAPRRARLKL